MSRPPYVSITDVIASFAAFGSVTSSAFPKWPLPNFSIAASKFSWFRSIKKHCAPNDANAFAVSNPIVPDPPVTITTFP